MGQVTRKFEDSLSLGKRNIHPSTSGAASMRCELCFRMFALWGNKQLPGFFFDLVPSGIPHLMEREK